MVKVGYNLTRITNLNHNSNFDKYFQRLAVGGDKNLPATIKLYSSVNGYDN